MPPASGSPRWLARLGRFSRSQKSLWQLALGLLLLGVLVGFALDIRRPSLPSLFGERALARAGLAAHHEKEDAGPRAETPKELLAAFKEELVASKPRFSDVLRAVPMLAPFIAPADYAEFHAALRAAFEEEPCALAADYLGAWLPGDSGAFDRLRRRAEVAAPPRYANYLVGRIELKRKNPRGAFEHFRREGEREEAFESRYFALRALAESNDATALAALQKEPRYAEFFTAGVALEAATQARDWSGMGKALLELQLDSWLRPVVIVALVTALGWGLFLTHLGEVPSPRSGYFALCVAGFVVGVLSTVPVVYAVIVEDEIFHFSAGPDVVRTVLYNVAGVGLREEAGKLLLFAPLLPFLVRRRDDLTALIVACFVGLGFAAEENGGYFTLSAAASAPGRFLTANFFHIALTGLNGLALYRAFTHGMRGINEFAFVFPLTVVAHGAYDALLDLPQLGDGGFFAMAVFVGFSYFFFNQVHPLRSNRRMNLSLTGTFVFGFALVAATMIAYQFATLGARAAAPLILTEMVGSAVLLVMFFREFNEPLAP